MNKLATPCAKTVGNTGETVSIGEVLYYIFLAGVLWWAYNMLKPYM
jgi:hypothetical protein